jgi:hypothetical protein
MLLPFAYRSTMCPTVVGPHKKIQSRCSINCVDFYRCLCPLAPLQEKNRRRRRRHRSVSFSCRSRQSHRLRSSDSYQHHSRVKESLSQRCQRTHATHCCLLHVATRKTGHPRLPPLSTLHFAVSLRSDRSKRLGTTFRTETASVSHRPTAA